MSELSWSNKATTNSIPNFNSPNYKLNDNAIVDTECNPNARLPINMHPSNQSPQSPLPPLPLIIHDNHLSPSRHHKKQSVPSIITTPSPEPYQPQNLNPSPQHHQRPIFPLSDKNKTRTNSYSSQELKNNDNDDNNDNQHQIRHNHDQLIDDDTIRSKQRTSSKPHIYQTMMYEPMIDSFPPPNTSTNIRYSNAPNINIINTSNNNHLHSRSVPSPSQRQQSSNSNINMNQRPNINNDPYYNKRQFNQLRMKHFNEQHKLNTITSNDVIHTQKKRKRNSISTKKSNHKHSNNPFHESMESLTPKPNKTVRDRPKIKRIHSNNETDNHYHSPPPTSYIHYDPKQSQRQRPFLAFQPHSNPLYRSEKTLKKEQESKSIKTKYTYYPLPMIPKPVHSPNMDHNVSELRGGIIPRYRPILKNESLSLPLGRPSPAYSGGHPGIPRPNPYIDEAIASPTISSTVSSSTNTTTPSYSSTSTYNATPIIMRYEKKTKISRRRSKTSEEIVTDQAHASPNGGFHHYESKIKIRKSSRKKKKNRIERCKSYDNSFSYYDDVNAEDEELKENEIIDNTTKRSLKMRRNRLRNSNSTGYSNRNRNRNVRNYKYDRDRRLMENINRTKSDDRSTTRHTTTGSGSRTGSGSGSSSTSGSGSGSGSTSASTSASTSGTSSGSTTSGSLEESTGRTVYISYPTMDLKKGKKRKKLKEKSISKSKSKSKWNRNRNMDWNRNRSNIFHKLKNSKSKTKLLNDVDFRSFTPSTSQLRTVVDDRRSEDSMDEHESESKSKSKIKPRMNRTESDAFSKRILRVREGKLGQRVVTFSRRKSGIDIHPDKHGKNKTDDINNDTGIEEKKDGIPLMSPLTQLSGNGSGSTESHHSHHSQHSQHGEHMMELQKLLEEEKSKLDAQKERMESLLKKMQDQHQEKHNALIKQKDELNDMKKKYETMIEEKEAEFKQRFDELQEKEKEFEERHATLYRNELNYDVNKHRLMRKEGSINHQQHELAEQTEKYDAVMSEFYMYQKTVNSMCNKHIELINKWLVNAQKVASDLIQFTTNPIQDILQNMLNNKSSQFS